MDRRTFLRGLTLLSLCPICARHGLASEGAHWSYEGKTGPDHWASLDTNYAACGKGSQQSPVNIEGSIQAKLPDLKVSWKKTSGAKIVNNGHTIQLNVPPGSTLATGDDKYEMTQFHFHAPSEHLIGGKNFAMEAHFVHQKASNAGLGVLGVFLVEGEANPVFGQLADAFPKDAGNEAAAPEIDPSDLLPRSMAYWKYEGSLTTPPCSEVVDWIVCQQPVPAARTEIAKFTALYAMNARPAQQIDRRLILQSM